MLKSEKEKQRLIHNLEVEIYCYENDVRKAVNSVTQKMSDIWARYRYELSKIQLEAFYKYDDALDRIKQRARTIDFRSQAEIRTSVSALASKGRTIKVTDLTKDELVEARKLANKIIDERIEKYRAAVL